MDYVKTDKFGKQPAESGVRILVIDDDPVIRKHLPILLTNEQHYAVSAESGEEAVELLERKHESVHAVNLALIDYHLGENRMNGIQTIKRIVEIKNIGHVWPVLYCLQDISEKVWKGAGAKTYLPKGNSDLLFALIEARRMDLHGADTAKIDTASYVTYRPDLSSVK